MKGRPRICCSPFSSHAFHCPPHEWVDLQNSVEMVNRKGKEIAVGLSPYTCNTPGQCREELAFTFKMILQLHIIFVLAWYIGKLESEFTSIYRVNQSGLKDTKQDQQIMVCILGSFKK